MMEVEVFHGMINKLNHRWLAMLSCRRDTIRSYRMRLDRIYIHDTKFTCTENGLAKTVLLKSWYHWTIQIRCIQSIRPPRTPTSLPSWVFIFIVPVPRLLVFTSYHKSYACSPSTKNMDKIRTLAMLIRTGPRDSKIRDGEDVDVLRSPAIHSLWSIDTDNDWILDLGLVMVQSRKLENW